MEHQVEQSRTFHLTFCWALGILSHCRQLYMEKQTSNYNRFNHLAWIATNVSLRIELIPKQQTCDVRPDSGSTPVFCELHHFYKGGGVGMRPYSHPTKICHHDRVNICQPTRALSFSLARAPAEDVQSVAISYNLLYLYLH